jgi:ketosteroid isomerase-like protein
MRRAAESGSAEATRIALGWLAAMESCVRAVDYARCRRIFADDVVGYGTRIEAAVGLDALERDQWRHIWGAIRGFTFQTDRLVYRSYGDGLWLACPWTSQGRADDGSWIARPGRMTAVLERRGERWLAVHTHFSLVPKGG